MEIYRAWQMVTSIFKKIQIHWEERNYHSEH
jgi:hypothetical protein